MLNLLLFTFIGIIIWELLLIWIHQSKNGNNKKWSLLTVPLLFIIITWQFPINSLFFGFYLILLIALALNKKEKKLMWKLELFPIFFIGILLLLSLFSYFLNIQYEALNNNVVVYNIITITLTYTIGLFLISICSYKLRDIWKYIQKNRLWFIVSYLITSITMGVYAIVGLKCHAISGAEKGVEIAQVNFCKSLNLYIPHASGDPFGLALRTFKLSEALTIIGLLILILSYLTYKYHKNIKLLNWIINKAQKILIWLILLIIFFTILNATSIHLSEKYKINKIEISETVQEKSQLKINQTDCTELGDNWLTLNLKDDVDLSFCYKKEWGKPNYKKYLGSKESRKGIDYAISFISPNAPFITFKTLDFQLLGNTSAGPFTCFKCINFNLNEDELIKALNLTEKNFQTGGEKANSLNKIIINNRNALYIKKTGLDFDQSTYESIEYHIPKILENNNYNLSITTKFGEEEDLQKLINSLIF